MFGVLCLQSSIVIIQMQLLSTAQYWETMDFMEGRNNEMPKKSKWIKQMNCAYFWIYLEINIQCCCWLQGLFERSCVRVEITITSIQKRIGKCEWLWIFPRFPCTRIALTRISNVLVHLCSGLRYLKNQSDDNIYMQEFQLKENNKENYTMLMWWFRGHTIERYACALRKRQHWSGEEYRIVDWNWLNQSIVPHTIKIDESLA